MGTDALEMAQVALGWVLGVGLLDQKIKGNGGYISKAKC